ncbi:MAG: hypothetical protein ABI858_05960 [Pseudoxanthomonas sp.]
MVLNFWRAAARARRGVFALCLAAFCGPFAQEANAKQVYWAGFAFTGADSELAQAAPHVDAALERHGVATLNQVLLAAQQRNPSAGLSLSHDELGRLDGSASSVVVAAALDREVVSVEKIGDHYKLLVEVAMQALFFDYRELQIIASYPLTLQRIDVLSVPPSNAQIDSVVEQLILGNSASDLPAVFARTMSAVNLPDAAVRRMQVVSVNLSEAARSAITTPQSTEIVRATLAHEFSKILGAGTGMGLLPPSTGQAIGGVMAARIADGKVFQLKIPAPDYAIHVTVDGLRNGVINETAVTKQVLFGAFFSVRVEEPFSRKVYFDQSLRKAAIKVVPESQQSIDYSSASFETLLAGFQAFTDLAAGHADYRAWLRDQKPGGKALLTQSNALQELIKSCL